MVVVVVVAAVAAVAKNHKQIKCNNLIMQGSFLSLFKGVVVW